MSITSQFAHNAKVIAAKRIAQPVKIWSMIVAYSGQKKSPLHKFFIDNIKKLKANDVHTMNHQKYDIIDVFGGKWDN